MKKLVLVISLVIAISVSVFGQINDSTLNVISDQFNSFMYAKNFNECLFSKYKRFNEPGCNDDNTHLFEIADNFLVDKNVRMQFANDPNVGRLKVTYNSESNHMIMFREWIANTNFNFDTSLFILKVFKYPCLDGEGASIFINVTNKNTNKFVFGLQLYFEHDPIKNFNNKTKLPKMNLASARLN